ncbi:MAG: transglycosylase domain-containing protein [bacterium]
MWIPSFNKRTISEVIIYLSRRFGVKLVPDAETRLNRWITQGADKLLLRDAARALKVIVQFEDRRFYLHFGVDLISLLGLLSGRRHRGGATTIAMQLARQVIVNPHHGRLGTKLKRKIYEMVMGTYLSVKCGRRAVLSMWLHHIPFGSPRIIGIITASRCYLNKQIEQLDELDGLLLVERISVCTGRYYVRRIERLAAWGIEHNLIRNKDKDELMQRFYRMVACGPGDVKDDLPNVVHPYRLILRSFVVRCRTLILFLQKHALIRPKNITN